MLAPSLVELQLPEAGQVRGSRSHTRGDRSKRTWNPPRNNPHGGRRAERKPEVTEPRGLDRVTVQLMFQGPRVRGTGAQGTRYRRDTDYREWTGTLGQEGKNSSGKKPTCCEGLTCSHPRDRCHSGLEDVGEKRTHTDTGPGRQNQGQLCGARGGGLWGWYMTLS